MSQLVCVCAFTWNCPALLSSLCLPAPVAPLAPPATNAITGVFLLEFLEAGAVPF